MEHKNKIYKLIADDTNFEKLTSRLSEFNPFKILKIQDYEIRHSNFLGWLFDPSENHNLDDRVLIKFLLKILISPLNQEKDNNVDMLKIYQNNLLDAKVYREYQNIDILIVSESNELVIIIENKIDSKEHSGQLKRYLEIVEKEFTGKMILPVFLSLEGQLPSTDQYYVATYSEIIGIIESITAMNNDRMSNEVNLFIQFYIKAVKEKLGMDAEFVKLCKDIYRAHKEAIDYISLYGKESKIAAAFELFVLNKEFVESGSRGSLHYVVSSDLVKKMESDWFTKNVVAIWFAKYKENYMQIVLEIGPFIDGEERVRFIEHLEANGLPTRQTAKRVVSKYTRIFSKVSKQIKETDLDNEEYICSVMEDLYQDEGLREAIVKLSKAIETFNWS